MRSGIEEENNQLKSLVVRLMLEKEEWKNKAIEVQQKLEDERLEIRWHDRDD